MSDSLLSCPTCGSQAIVKNGQTRHGKQNYKCNDCPKGYRFAYGRQFVENPQGRRIPEETKVLIDRLLLEKIPLAGIARVLKISETWLQNYVNNKYDAVYRQCTVFYSDFWVSYPVAFPSNRHRAVGKETGLTSYIERFNGTLRQRVSRLVRKRRDPASPTGARECSPRQTLSFSKKLENHISAIWYFIHHYNTSLPVHSSFPF